MAPGGVGRNIAENLARLGTRTHLVAAIGADALGDQVLAATVGGRRARRARTPQRAGHRHLHRRPRRRRRAGRGGRRHGAPPTSWRPEQVHAARDLVAGAGAGGARRQPRPGDARARPRPGRRGRGARCVLEPVSVPKAAGARRRWSTPDRPLYAVTPNRDELAALTGLPTAPTRRAARRRRGPARARRRATSGCGSASDGSLLEQPAAEPSRSPPCPTEVDGRDRRRRRHARGLLPRAAGAATSPVAAAAYGHAAAALTIASPHTVRPDLTDRLVRGAALADPQEPQTDAPPHAHPHRRGRRGAGRRHPGRRAGEHDHQPRHALPAERRDGASRSRASSASTARCRPRSPSSTAGRGSAWTPTTSSCWPATPTSPRSACATCRTSSPAAPTAPPRSPPPCGSRRWPASAPS